MAFYPDGSVYVYGSTAPEPYILNVGWLSKDYPYVRGATPDWLLDRLRVRVASPVNLYRGYHVCDFCPESPKKTLPNGIQISDHPTERMGNGEIRVQALDGKIYVAPRLIYHYVSGHGYLPPAEFIAALAADLPQPGPPQGA